MEHKGQNSLQLISTFVYFKTCRAVNCEVLWLHGIYRINHLLFNQQVSCQDENTVYLLFCILRI